MKKLGRRMVARLMAGVLTVSLGLGPASTVKAEEIWSEDMLEVITADHGEGVSEGEKTDALQDEAASVSENEAIGGDENEEDNEPEDETVKEKPDDGSTEAEEQEESQTDSMTEGEKPAESSEEDKEAENVGVNDVESDISVEQQEAVRTAGTVAQAADIISGTDWTLDAAGKLTIWSDAGMKDWLDSGQADYNEKIISAEIQNGVTSVEEYAFSSCSSLASITIPSSVARIGGYAFFQCSSLTSVTIQAGVESIGNDAFSGCSSLVSIELPLGVTDIGAGAFQDCSDLTDIILPTSVTDIGDGVFRRCRSLTNIEIPPETTNIGGGALSDCSSLTNITLPVGLTSIGAWIFNGCSNLTDITLPANVTSIGSGAFSGCSGLTSVMLPISVTSIENNAFSDCGSLTNITLPTDMTNIGNSAFSGCSSLTSITIPANVTSIGSSAFQGCSKLETVLMQGTTPSTLGEDAFKGSKFVTDNTRGIEVPLGTGATYRDSWKRWAEYITDGGPLASGPDWTLGLDGKLTIRSDEGMVDWQNVGRKNNSKQVVSVELQDGVTSIGSQAFYNCSSLMNIELPSSVTGMGSQVFWGCSSLTSIALPPRVTNIGAYAFQNCSSLINIELPSSVTSIGNQAFSNCSSLTSIELSPSVTSIGDFTFDGCSSLLSIELPAGVTSIGRGAFSNCSSLTSIILPPSVTNIGELTFNCCRSLTSIMIPTDVVSIGNYAFQDCSNLESVTMQGTTPPALAIDVFDGCKFVIEYKQGIKVPWGVAETYKKVWKEWARHITDDSLLVSGADWTFDLDGKLTIWSDEGMKDWQNAGKENHIEKIASVELQDGVTSIGSNTFSGCSNLISITIPSGVTDIGTSAFQDCSSLAGITLPPSVTSIEGSAFYNCSSLTNMTLPAGVTSIGSNTFRGCSDLTSITIPSGVADIGTSAFQDCSSLAGITLPPSVTSIGAYAFYNCSLTSMTLPAGVTSIEYSTFRGCSDLTSITIPSGVADIGTSAFQDCSSLAGITLPSSVTSIGGSAFYNCSSLTSMTLPAGVTSIGSNTFRGCSDLTSITIPSGVADIRTSAFQDCSSLAGITLPPSVTSIGAYAFYNCSSLTSITIPAGVASIEYSTFSGCSKLTSITLPSSVTSIEWSAFFNCSSLESIALPVDITSIGNYAFFACSSLERVTMQGTTPPVLGIADEDTGETKIFNSCKFVTDNTKGIKVPTGTMEAYKAAWLEWADYITDGSVPTDGKEKVKAVKQAVEVTVKNAIDKALAGTKVTNDNAEETAAKIETLIPDAVAEAMAETGISTDEVEVGEAGIEIKQAGDSEGSIQITIYITSKEDAEQSDSAVVQVPIVTSEGDTDLTKDAQKMVEDALKKITVTNETTREDILDALKKELYDEVTVEGIEKFNKVEATEEAPGSISLSIRITIDGQTTIINTSVLIAQLGKKTGVYIRFTDYYELDGSIPCYKYTGAAVKPTVEVYNNETMLIPGTDYTIAYKNNIKVGSTAALTVKGKRNFSGTSNVVKFKIINADIERDTVHPTEMTVVVNTKVAPTIMNGTKKLTTKDYRLEGTGISNSKYAVATAEGNPNILTVKGIGSYEGSSFDIRVRVIERSAAKKLAVVVDRDFKPVYNGMTINMSSLINNTQGTEGVITVTDAKDRTKILKEGTDFAVLCSSNLLCAGTVKFTITGMGEYTGSVSKSFKISPLRITDSSRFSVSFDERKTYEYKASGTTVDNLLVTYLGETGSVEDDKILTEGVDYKVTYSNHKKVSGAKDARLKITFLGNYKGSSAVSRTFKIVTAKMSAANTEVTVPDKVYSKANRAYKSTPIVTVDGVAIKASNYTVSYAWATGSEAADNTKYVSDNKVKITIAEGDIWAKVKVTITPKQTSNYALDKGAVLTGEYYVRKADNAVNLSKAKVTFLDKNAIQLKSLEYNGNPFYTPAGNNIEANNAAEDPNAVYLRVIVNGRVVDPDLYDVIWTNATEKGRATVVIRGKGIDTGKGFAVGSKNQSVNIKAMALKGKTPQSLMENTTNAISNLMSIF